MMSKGIGVAIGIAITASIGLFGKQKK